MDKLLLVWKAFFKDETIIKQFEGDIEHPFRDVLQYQEKSALVAFELENTTTSRIYRVDLARGTITIKSKLNLDLPIEDDVMTNKANCRLIYFRRVTRQMSWNGSKMATMGDPNILYFIGVQHNEPDGRNHKTLLQISDRDDMHIV